MSYSGWWWRACGAAGTASRLERLRGADYLAFAEPFNHPEPRP